VLFGVTGGVTEAVLRRVSESKSRAALLQAASAGQRGMEGIKEFYLDYGDRKLHIAVVSGLGNAERVLLRASAGEHFDFIEIMACPGGCINGGGQPYAGDAKAARSKGLYDSDRMLSIRRAEENPVVASVYKKIIKDRAHELLHVHYTKK
jgi:NADH-quinone oxidoreductase subunit G